jgi:carbonic anhydrase
MDEVFTRMRKDNNCSMGMSARVVFLEHLDSVCRARLERSRVQIDERLRKGVVFLVVVALLTSLSLQAQWKTRWEYEGAKGPDHWSELDPAYASCNTGVAQSPIDIEGSEKAALPALRFESRSGPLRYIVNNGYTIRVNYHDAAGTGNLLTVGDKTYQLTQFHFHRPSEEYIHGKAYDMSLT